MNKLDYKEIAHNRYKYELGEDISFPIPEEPYGACIRHFLAKNPVNHKYIRLDNSQIICAEGYRWDGCSGPTWDTESTMCASLVHDSLYQLMRLSLIPQSSKDFADRWFLNIMLLDGVWKIRAYTFYYGVTLFGASSCVPIRQK